MTFRSDLEDLINRHSQENGCNTPDFILADYLSNCLLAFDNAVNARERWYGRKQGWRSPIQPTEMNWKPPADSVAAAPIPLTEGKRDG